MVVFYNLFHFFDEHFQSSFLKSKASFCAGKIYDFEFVMECHAKIMSISSSYIAHEFKLLHHATCSDRWRWNAAKKQVPTLINKISSDLQGAIEKCRRDLSG